MKLTAHQCSAAHSAAQKGEQMVVVARRLGVTANTLRKYFHRYGLPLIRGQRPALGAEFRITDLHACIADWDRTCILCDQRLR